MSVFYKFKSTSTVKTISFNKKFVSISVQDVKEEIIKQNKLRTVNNGTDLRLINSDTKEVYEDTALIPQNTFLEVARVPIFDKPKTSYRPLANKTNKEPEPVKITESWDYSNCDLTKLDCSELTKIDIMMCQSAKDYYPVK